MNMEIEIVRKEGKDELLRIEGEDHTLANLLCSELYQDDAIQSASYTLDHPLTKAILFHVSTEGKSPEKAMEAAADRLVKKLQELKREMQTKLKRA